jgi:hypothetical protein
MPLLGLKWGLATVSGGLSRSWAVCRGDLRGWRRFGWLKAVTGLTQHGLMLATSLDLLATLG